MPTRSQPHRLQWPLTPHQVEATDDMFQILFKAVRAIESSLVANIDSDFVPYSGANANVDLGSHNLTTTGVVTAASFVGSGIGLTGLVPYTGAVSDVLLGANNLQAPKHTGGTAVGSSLTLQSTSAVGTTDFISFLVGNAGAMEGMRVLHDGTVKSFLQILAYGPGGAVIILNNTTADAGVTGNCYLTFQTDTTTRWYLGMSPSAATGNFELYNNIGAMGLILSANKTTGIFTLAKGLVVTTGGITGTLNTAAQANITSVGTLTSLVVSGAITAGSPLIVHANGTAQRIDIGAVGDTSSSSQLRLFQDSTHFNWQIGAGTINNDTISFTPSTVVNGTTFSSPLFTINASGTTSFAAHTVSAASSPLLSIDNTAADAGVTNAVYMTFKTASTVRYYVGISTSAGNGNFEIYNNVAGKLAFSVDKTLANIGICGVTAATAKLHIAAGTATASTAPLKLTAGTLLTTPELGAIEFTDDGTTAHLYVTTRVATVVTRVQIA